MDAFLKKALATTVTAAVAAALAAGTALGGVTEFHAFLLPAATDLGTGQSADMRFEVDSTAVQFNGYQVTIRFDPAILALEGVSEGALMSGACGNTFFTVSETESTVTVTHVILCGQNPASLDGPGVLSVYRMRGVAQGVSPFEITSDPDSTFADAGTPLNPDHPSFPRQVIFHNASIRVRDGSAVGVPEPMHAAVLEQNAPNPFNPATQISFETDRPGAVLLEIIDPRGRRIWHRAWGDLRPGRHRVEWQGTDLEGLPVASGVYLYRIITPAGAATRKMTLLR